MATLKQIRNKTNARLAIVWPLIVEWQNNRFAKYGEYGQKLITNRPVDGEELDYVDRLPSDEKHPGDAVLVLDGGKIPFQLSIDEWTRDNEAGWSATINIELLNGDIYTRNRTNENIDSGWNKYDPNDYLNN